MKHTPTSLNTRTIAAGFSRVKSSALVLAFSLLIGHSAQAVTETWNGAGTAWQTSTNWTPNGAPSATTLTEFNSTANDTNQPTTGSSTAAATGAIWVTTGVDSTVTISGAQTLTIAGNLTAANGPNGVINTAILLDDTANNNLTINAPVNVSHTTSFTVNNAGTLTIGGGLTITAGQTLTLSGSNASGIITISSAIANTTGALTVSTSGAVNLNATNSYTGNTSVSKGTLNLNAAGAVSAGTLTVSGTSLTSQTLTESVINAISGSAGLSMGGSNSGTSTITLSKANNFTGAVSIGNIGTNLLTLSDPGAIASATSFTLQAGTLSLLSNSPATFTSPVALLTNPTISVDNNGSGSGNALTLSGGVSFNANGRGLTITGGHSYSLILPSVTYAGTTGNVGDSLTPTTATVSVGAITSTATAGIDTFTLAGTTSAANSVTGVISNGTGGATVAITVGGASGTAPWTFSGANSSYTGLTTISDGTVLSVTTLANGGSNSSIGATTNAAANLVINVGTLQYTGGAASTDRLFTIGATATIDASGTGAINFNNAGNLAYNATNSARTLTLTGSNTGANTLAALIANDGTGAVGLTKNGAGTWILTNANTYTGATTVGAGTLALSAGGSLAGTAVSVGGTGTLQINGNRSIGTSGVASVAVNSGGTLSLVDGAINTLTLNTTSGNSLVMGGGGTLAFDLGATSDQILLSSGTASVTGNTTVTINSLGSLSGTTQTLISAAGGGLGTTGFTLGTITGSTGSYTLSLNETNNNLFLNETSSGAVTAAFWSGANGTAWNATGPTNFNTDLGSNIPTSGIPSSVTDVTFTATGASNFAATTLGQDFTINSLTFNTAGVGIGGANTLTILAGNANGHTMGDGITSSGSGTNTISSAVALGSSQTWTVNTGNTLAVSGLVSDGGHAYSLTTGGAGKLSLTNSTGNTYTGGTTVGGTSTLLVGNSSGSATGSGALSVLRGAALAGTGTSSGSSFAIGGTSGSGTASIYVGQSGATGDTNTTSKLTLLGAGASTIANANLTFNLDTTSLSTGPGAGNELLVGGTAITFGSGAVGANPVTLTLNLQGNTAVTNVPYFVLIAGTGGGGTSATSQYSGLTFGNSFTADGGLLTPILNSSVSGSGNLILALNTAGYSPGSAGFYGGQAGLFLFQAGGIDDIVVIPEPGTWALMLGGLAVLIFWQRRKNKLDLPDFRITRHGRQAAHQNTNGFSLVELLCVLAVMSILAAMSGPFLSGIMSGNKLTNNIYELSALIQQAKTVAMTQNTYVWLGFNSYTQNGSPSLMVAAISAKSGLASDLQNNNYQLLTKTAILTNAALDTTKSYLGLPGLDQADNNDAAAQSAYSFTLSVAGKANVTFNEVIAFGPDGSVNLPQADGTLNLVPCVGIGLNLGHGPGAHTAAVQIHGLSGQIAVFQR